MLSQGSRSTGCGRGRRGGRRGSRVGTAHLAERVLPQRVHPRVELASSVFREVEPAPKGKEKQTK